MALVFLTGRGHYIPVSFISLNVYTYAHMYQEIKQDKKTETKTNIQSREGMGDPGGSRNPVTQGGHAPIWLWFYGRHKPDGPQLVLLGQTASPPEVVRCDQQYF